MEFDDNRNYFLIILFIKTTKTMKKTFSLKFLVLSALLMVGNVFAFAQGDPTSGQAVGTTLSGNVVTYRVAGASTITVSGEKAYPVTITGLDADGLEALKGDNPTIELNVPVTFREKLGENYYRFYVTEIKEGSLHNSFYGYQEISKLHFTKAPSADATLVAEKGIDGAWVDLTNASVQYDVKNKAFYGCSNMTELTFTSNCKSIGEYAFQNTAITSFTIPAKCATISKYAFYNCRSLLTVTVESGNNVLATIGNYVFGNSAVNTIDLTNASALTKLEGKPFIYALDPAQTNDVLKEITLPASLTTIDATVFQNCTFLQKVNGLQATKVTEIKDKSFLNCRNLTQLDLPNADIVNAPFVGCVKLATLTFPDGYNKEIAKSLAANTNLYGTTDIANAAYSAADQGALKTITFKKATTAIGFFGQIAASAFKGSLALNKVEFLAPLKGGASIGANAFEDVTTLATVTFSGIDTWASKDVNNYTYDAAITIGASAFKNTGITALSFGGITTQGYDSDKKLYAGNGKAVTFSANAFSNCASLATITFGGLKIGNAGSISIAANAFSENAALTSVDFGNATFELIASKKPVSGTDFGTIKIAENAFVKNPLLATVTFGTTTYTKKSVEGTDVFANGLYQIWDGAFSTGNVALANVAFGNIVNTTGNVGTVEIGWDATLEASTNLATDFPANPNALVFGDGEHLQTVTFGDWTGTPSLDAGLMISNGAFASTGLTSVKFGAIQAPKDLATSTGFVIGKNAFKGGAAAGKTVEFKTISNNSTASSKGELGFVIFDNAFAAESLKSVTMGNISASTVTIAQNAFQGKSLETVSIEGITAYAKDNSVVSIADNAFQGGEVNNKTVTIGQIADNNTNTLGITIGQYAFAGEKLQTVEIAKGKSIAANTVNIKKGAFQGKSLKTVTLGKITATKTNATVAIGEDAFQGGEVENKTVTIGDIVNNKVGGTTYTLDATIAKNAFSGKLLETLNIGNMTANSIAISGDYAFANLSTITDADMTETVTIGELGAGLTITGNDVFQGPKADDSELHVTIDKIGGAATIPANTFVAPVKGKASYTVKGDVVAGALANVAAGAFVGSKENVVTPVKNTTSVKFQGDYLDEFVVAAPVFTNVNDVELAVDKDGNAKNYNVLGNLKFFGDAKKVTIGNIPATKYVIASHATYCSKIEEVTFVGSVLGNVRVFASPLVRKINFANVATKDVKVAKGAILNSAFQAAAEDALAKGEKIIAIYKEAQTHDEAVNIFARNTFVAVGFNWTTATPAEQESALANAVTLYTTSWCKANVFEAADNDQADLNGQKKYVWRLGYSESDVAPGEDIIAKVAKPEGYTYAYGKLFIPKGISGKYKIKSEYDEATDKNKVQIYYGQIDNSNSKIYMYQLPIINDFFWIDATDVDHAFVIRTNKDVTEIKAEPVEEDDADEAKAIEDNDNFYYFGTARSVQNQLRYPPAKVVNQELRSNGEFKDRAVWMMANPATYGFGFTKIDKKSEVNGVPRYMPAKSLYVVGKEGSDVISAARNLTIVFADEETNTTGIETVETAEQNSDAIYNLNGVRVNGAQKGIYIKNGKKYIVK